MAQRDISRSGQESRNKVPRPGIQAASTGLCSLGILLVLLAGSGCKSTDKPASASFASVELHGNTPGQISEMAERVFQRHGYGVARGGPTRLVFEKKATSWNNFAYGNWLETAVWERVRASIEPVSAMGFRLQCQAYMVRDLGSTTEEEIKVLSLHSHPYQKMLDEVAKGLASPAAGSK